MEFSYSQTENFEMEKLSSDTGYFKKPVEINRGFRCNHKLIYFMLHTEGILKRHKGKKEKKSYEKTAIALKINESCTLAVICEVNSWFCANVLQLRHLGRKKRYVATFSIPC